MIARLIGVMMACALAFAGMCAQADEVRPPSLDAIVSGEWSITWNTQVAGLISGGRYVQAYSDRRLHWSDSTRDIRTFGRPGAPMPGLARCEDSSELSEDDMTTLRDLVRAVYQIEIPDGTAGIGSAFLQVTITRGGRNYIVGLVHYQPGLENLDPRLAKANAIFQRYSCAAPSPSPQPLRG